MRLTVGDIVSEMWPRPIQEHTFDIGRNGFREERIQLFAHLPEELRDGQVLLCLRCIVEYSYIVAVHFEHAPERVLNERHQEIGRACEAPLEKAQESEMPRHNQLSDNLDFRSSDHIASNRLALRDPLKHHRPVALLESARPGAVSRLALPVVVHSGEQRQERVVFN